MGKSIVRCPTCHLVLSLPESSQEYIRCPCDAVLINPFKTGQQNTGRKAPVEETGKRKPGLTADGAPIRTADESRPDCEICLTVFTVLRRRHHCRNCGALVCRTCSEKKWPAGMMPESYNYRHERFVRVCNSCHTAMERFRKCCLNGDVESAKRLHSCYNVHPDLCLSIFPHALYPIHCAASSGSIELVRWLLELRCNVKVVDDRGWGILAFAAQKQHISLMNYLVVNKVADMAELQNPEILQNCLTKALEMLRRNVNPRPLPAQANSQAVSHSAPVPASFREEDEQLQMAIAASIAASGQLQTGQGNFKEEGNNAATKSRECVICFEEAELGNVFVPCGHTCCCESCASQFNGQPCPVCRETVEQVVKTYSVS